MIANLVELSVLLAVGLLLINLAWHRPGWVIFAAISIAALLDLFEIGTGGLNIGFSLYINDALSIAVLGTGFLTLKRYHKKFPRDAVPCFALFALIALSFSRGISPFGLKAAGNSARDLFYFVTPAFAIMLLRPAFRLDAVRLARWIEWAGFFLSAVALLRWAGLLPMPVSLADDFREVVRSLNANEASIVCLAFISEIYLQFLERRSSWRWVGIGIFGAVIIALQHRSVWVATAAGLAWLAFRTVRLFRARWVAFGTTACIVLCVIMVSAPRVLKSVRELATVNVQETEKEDSTWAWRVAGYEVAADRLFASEPVNILIGPPAGWAADLMSEDVASTIIHSRYVEVLAYYGIVGFAVLLLWFGMLVRRVGWSAKQVPRRPARDLAGAVLIEALLLAVLVYLVPYSGGLIHGAVLGLIWVAATQNNISIGARRVDFACNQLVRRNKPAILPS